MRDAHLTTQFRRHVCQTSDSPVGLVVERARGTKVFTRDGREYLDFISGICVANIGHTHPEVVAAVQRQAAEYLHVMVFGEYVLPVQVELAARLPPQCRGGPWQQRRPARGTRAGRGAPRS